MTLTAIGEKGVEGGKLYSEMGQLLGMEKGRRSGKSPNTISKDE